MLRQPPADRKQPFRCPRRVAGVALFVAAVGMMGLAGCVQTGGGSASVAGIDPVQTGSIEPAPLALAEPDAPSSAAASGPAPTAPDVVASLATSDWDAIRLRASAGLATLADGGSLDWNNGATGSSGTLLATAPAKAAPGGRTCRPFALTVSDVRGIRGYRGEACRLADDSWQLFAITADDKALL